MLNIMKAKDQEQIKGIYYNEINGNVYFVNKVEEDLVIVSTVLIHNDCMIKVLNDKKIIGLETFKEFTLSGNYSIEDINEI